MEGCRIMSFLKGAGLGDILGTISPGLGALTGKGLGAELLPILSPALGLSGLFGHHGGGDDKSAAEPAAPAPNGAATGLGHLLGVDPSRISSIAGGVGKAANQIATAGGAQGGYAAPEMPAINNHMQMLDPAVLRALIAHFSGGGGINNGGGTVHPQSY
jgi:hypothetical protein